MYAKVNNGTIVGTMYNLPATFNNISGFNTLDAATLAEHGFFLLEEIKPELTFNEMDDGDKDENNNPILRKVPTEAYGQSTDEILTDKVVRTYSVIPLPAVDVKEEKNRPALKKIAHEESKQARAIREAVLGQPGAVARLQAIDDKIAALRARLV